MGYFAIRSPQPILRPTKWLISNAGRWGIRFSLMSLAMR